MNPLEIILIFYVVPVVINIISLYLDFREKYNKKEVRTVEDFVDDLIYYDKIIHIFFPVVNLVLAICIVIALILTPIWNIIKKIRIV